MYSTRTVCTVQSLLGSQSWQCSEPCIVSLADRRDRLAKEEDLTLPKQQTYTVHSQVELQYSRCNYIPIWEALPGNLKFDKHTCTPLPLRRVVADTGWRSGPRPATTTKSVTCRCTQTHCAALGLLFGRLAVCVARNLSKLHTTPHSKV